jgi:anthranilate synthase component 1
VPQVERRLPEDVHPRLVQRARVLAGLNFTEGPHPQDCPLRVRVSGQEYQLSLSFFPAEDGEAVLVRVVDRAAGRPAVVGDLRVTSIPSRDEYVAAVLKAKEYIAAGDIIQVVLSRRLQVDVSAPPFQVYRALRSVNPSPYMFFLQFEECQLIGASPEILVTERARQVVTRPIAGTVRRGKTPEEDAALEEQLLADPKERAEHIMLVDLHRNDIGRVCEYGSVHVDQLMTTEKYSHVIHIVSNVVGRLRRDKDAYDLIRAAFPAGTLSGAPKIRAMEIIEELETVKRGPYGGCIGYFSFSGDMDTAITLRTIVVKGHTAYVQAGGGIVADSDPAAEFQETESKAGALLRAIEMAERGLE